MKKIFFYGLGVAGVLGVLLFAPSHALAATNISATSTAHWAWNDEIGWIDFNTNTAGNVNVGPTVLEGYASSSAGPISLNCDATNPKGVSICSPNQYRVTNDGSGDLSGWAWNDEIGWISFYWGDASSTYPTSTATTGLCQSYGSYCGVSISGGKFSGWAWNDVVGWINFNCTNGSGTGCSNGNFDVETSWIPVAATGTVDSETFDTGVTSGAELNSVMWQGTLNGIADTPFPVSFQFAVSNSSSGPWNYVGCDGTSGTAWPQSLCSLGTGSDIPGTPIPLGYSLSGRYFRYRTILQTNVAQTISPRVTNVIVNWSP